MAEYFFRTDERSRTLPIEELLGDFVTVTFQAIEYDILAKPRSFIKLSIRNANLGGWA